MGRPGDARRAAATSACAYTPTNAPARPGCSHIGIVVRYRHGWRRAGLVPDDAESVGVVVAAELVLRALGLAHERVRRIEERFGDRDRLDRRTRGADIGDPNIADIKPSSGQESRTAEAGEDLAADRVVPVAERGAHRDRIGRPRPAAQHLVLGAEEHLGVLAVGERPEARVAREVGARSTPTRHRAAARSRRGSRWRGGCRSVDGAHRCWPRLRGARATRPRRRDLPLGLGGQAGAAPAGEGVGLVPAHVLDGLVARAGPRGDRTGDGSRSRRPRAARTAGATRPASCRHVQPASVQWRGSS